MLDDLPVLDGTMSADWPSRGFTGFVFTEGRTQPWAYLSGGKIFAYGVSKKMAWAKSMPRQAAVRE